jgi:hypothetical protein
LEKARFDRINVMANIEVVANKNGEKFEKDFRMF